MLKAVVTLMNTKTDKKVGNHRSVHQFDGITSYYYHYTAICTVNESEKTFITTNGGWKTVSTTKAINSYKQGLTQKGYTEVEALTQENKKYAV